jgi:hypothetical protein
MESNQIDILACTMLRDFEQIDDAQEPRLPSQHGGDVLKAYLLDRFHLNLPFFHLVPAANPHMGSLPNADTAGYFSSTNALAKSLRENHSERARRYFADWIFTSFS